MHKKELYHPAPDRPRTAPLKTLPQGEVKDSNGTGPKIRKVMPKDPQKQMTSTIKSNQSCGSAIKPIIVCHRQTDSDFLLKSEDFSEKEIAEDTVEPPLSMTITSKDNKMPLSKVDSSTISGAKKLQPRKAYFVKSRYKQSAAKFSESSKSTTLQVSSMSSRSQGNSQRELPEVKTPTWKKNIGKTSTPTSTHHASFDWNESVIAKSQKNTSNSQAKSSSSKVQKKTNETSDTLEMVYVRYLQWHYCNSLVKSASRSKAKQTASQLKFLYEKNRDLAEECSELELEVNRLEYLDKLKQQLESQAGALGPVVDKLDSVSDQFQTLSENLDTTLHNLPLTDIINPDEDKLESVLQETRHFLGQINILTHSQAPSVQAMSKSSSTLRQNCFKEVQQIKIADDRLVKAASLKLQQCSLEAQIDNARREESNHQENWSCS